MLLLAAISAAVSIVLTVFWQAIKVFILAAADKIKQVLMGATAEAVNVFIRRCRDGLKNVSCNYINQGGRYLEKIVSKKLDPNAQLPSNIQARVNNVGYEQDVDITNDFAQELKLA